MFEEEVGLFLFLNKISTENSNKKLIIVRSEIYAQLPDKKYISFESENLT
jgi:hypothetical protein